MKEQLLTQVGLVPYDCAWRIRLVPGESNLCLRTAFLLGEFDLGLGRGLVVEESHLCPRKATYIWR